MFSKAQRGGADMVRRMSRRRKRNGEIKNVTHQLGHNAHCHRRLAVARKRLHPDGTHDQKDFERGRHHRGGFVASIGAGPF
jgi:hypothetical protein